MTVKSIVRQKQANTKELEPLFWSYFHNKMMMLLMMIEHPYINRNILSIEKQRIFLHDIYHHFLPSQSAHKHQRAFQYLLTFLNQFPDAGPKRTLKAIKMVGIIYEVFGFEMAERTEEIRLKKECVTQKEED